jgi:GTP-binding protein Era
MLLYHDEVPYATAIAVDEFAEREQGKDFIRAVIWVERESQRMILIGKGGSSLKRLGSRARSAVERMLDRPVYLELWVKVRPKWREHQEDLIHFGFTSGSSSP